MASALRRPTPSKVLRKAAAPAEGVMPAHAFEQRLVALLSLGEPHLERHLDIVGHLLDIVGIDDQRFLHLLGRAGKARQNEHAGIVRVLCGNVFLGDEVHAVAQRRDQADARVAINFDQHFARRRAVDVLDRHPVELAVAAVDACPTASPARGGCRRRRTSSRASAARSAKGSPGGGSRDTFRGSGRRRGTSAAGPWSSRAGRRPTRRMVEDGRSLHALGAQADE